MRRTRSAAHSTIALVLSRGVYFFLGYVVAVLLARGLGPVAYGSYGVIMAVLVWLEQSARHAVPAATAKQLAELPHGSRALQWSSIALNLPLHLAIFAVVWVLAPWLEARLHIEDGTWLFRIAMLDLPLYAVYGTLQAIHQGHRDFIRISGVEIAYMATKVVGVLWLLYAGMSVLDALLVNIAASVVAIALLLPGTGPWRSRPELTMLRPLVALAAPIGFYSLCQLLASNLDLLTLRFILPQSEGAAVGVYVAALNIARVPGVGLAAVAAVILPAISRALAQGDEALALRYVQQALRFFSVLFLPALFVLSAAPEELMQLLYSHHYSGGGLILSVLLVAHGLWAVHAILAFVLVAAGQVGKLALMMAAWLLPALVLFVTLTNAYQGLGAALANVCVPALANSVLLYLVRARFGPFLAWRSFGSIAAAGLLMFALGALVPGDGAMVLVSCALGLVAYGGTLWLLGEVRLEELARLRPGRRANEPAG